MYSIEQQQAGLELIKQLLSKFQTTGSAAAQAGFEETPTGMLFLLRVANGEAEPMALAARYTGQSELAIKSALIGFIVQSSLVEEGDYYRVLSLNPWCSFDEAKEHYRLLIRLFHPDRSAVDSALAEHCAARINQSYLAIKQQFSEASDAVAADISARDVSAPVMHDTTSRRPVSKPAGKAAMSSVARRAGFSRVWLPSGLTPTRIWLIILTLTSLILFSLYWANKEDIQSRYDLPTFAGFADESDQSSMPSKVEIKSYQTLISEHHPAAGETMMSLDMPQNGLVDTDRPTPAAALIVKPVNPQQLSPTVEKNAELDLKSSQPAMPKLLAVDQQRQIEITRPDVAMRDGARYLPANKAPVIAPAAEPEARGTMSAASNLVKPALTASAVKPDSDPVRADLKTEVLKSEIESPPLKLTTSEHVSLGLTEEALFNVISKLVLTYNQGDIDGFMALLDEDVHTEQGVGKDLLRQSYMDVFSNSQSRDIVLKNLQWKKSAQGAVGISSYQVSLVKKGETRQKHFAGTLRLEISKMQDKLTISGFYNLPDMK